jgi:hypothetical protein
MVTIMCLMVVFSGVLMFKPYQGYKIKDIPEEVKLPPMAVKLSGPLPVYLPPLPANDSNLTKVKILPPLMEEVEACALAYLDMRMNKKYEFQRVWNKYMDRIKKTTG